MASLKDFIGAPNDIGGIKRAADDLLKSMDNLTEINPNAQTNGIVDNFLCCHVKVKQIERQFRDTETELEIMKKSKIKSLKKLKILRNQIRLKLKAGKLGRANIIRRQATPFKITKMN